MVQPAKLRSRRPPPLPPQDHLIAQASERLNVDGHVAWDATLPPFDTAVRMQWALLPFAERYYRELSSAVG
eukprot:COSAG05_NODE_11876_length_492_cov_0.786260_1_plen_70_part_10